MKLDIAEYSEEIKHLKTLRLRLPQNNVMVRYFTYLDPFISKRTEKLIYPGKR